MNRRDLIRQIACSSAAFSMLNLGLSSRAHAVVSDRHWVFITAQGGWDMTNQWDPKGSELDIGKGPMNHYSRNSIRSAGNLRYAPPPSGTESEDKLHNFTQQHFQKMLVINGIDQATNSHSVGRRVAMVGSSSKALPSMGALLAAPYESNQSMPFIVAGGYSATAGLLPESKLLNRNGYANLINPDKFMGRNNTANEEVFDIINRRKQQQMEEKLASAKTEADIRALNKLANARNGSGGIAELLERIPGELNNDSNFAAAEIAAAGFASGAATSLSMRVGGFDTHNNNDENQWKSMDKLLSAVEHLLEHLSIQDVAHKTTIIIGSDFGRRPFYNKDNGKDHWPVTSMIAMGAGINGNTVIGGTDDSLNPKSFNPTSLEEDENGIKLNPASIFGSLRRMAGIEGTSLSQLYPLNGEYMAIFD